MKFILLPIILISSILYSQQEDLNYFPNQSSLTLVNPAFSIDQSVLSTFNSFNNSFNLSNVLLGINKNKNNFSLIHSSEVSSPSNDFEKSSFKYSSLQYTRLIKLSENENLIVGSEFQLQQSFRRYGNTTSFNNNYFRGGLGFKYSNKYFFIGSSYKLTPNQQLGSFWSIQAGTDLKAKKLTISPSIVYSRYHLFFNNLYLMLNMNYKWFNLQSGYNVNDQLSLGARIDLNNISFGYVFSETITKLNSISTIPTTHSFNISFKIDNNKTKG